MGVDELDILLGHQPLYQGVAGDGEAERGTAHAHLRQQRVAGMVDRAASKEALTGYLGKPAIVAKAWMFKGKPWDWCDNLATQLAAPQQLPQPPRHKDAMGGHLRIGKQGAEGECLHSINSSRNREAQYPPKDTGKEDI
uniref:Uncharacterized protein n=1 Tax=Magnetococcus massalia (strain MO-1) TaxID=451514 RepID=A0A1S7LMD6_MAGMO|nr:protein of unknown function [Candidatus Magnetococcus massalia]